jgi:ubiquinol-cytochrome c reductase cytochrome b subunit
MRLRDWVDHRTGYRGALGAALDERVVGGASFAYVMGSVLLFLLALQATTGVLAGDEVQAAMQGGNEYGNLTLTRFYALHVLVLPALTLTLVTVHVMLFRRHGVTPGWRRSPAELRWSAQRFWPAQLFRDVVAMAVAFAALLGWTVHQGGAGLDAPADPSSDFDARPEWYFRPLFELLKHVPGSLESLVALGAPMVVGGVLIALPLLDRGDDRSPRRRAWAIGLIAAGIAGAMTLTAISYSTDAGDRSLAERVQLADARARRARDLAIRHGVPAAGGTAVYSTAPFYRARTLWAEHCASCHEGDERRGPLLGPHYNDRAWIRGFLQAPSDDRYFGRTKLAHTEDSMPPAEETGDRLDALVEAIYAESGASDVDQSMAARGRVLFDEGSCIDCHERTGYEPSSGPNLAGRGSARYLAAFIADPQAPRFFGTRAEMPRFGDALTVADIEALSAWLVWLRDATPDDVLRLDR